MKTEEPKTSKRGRSQKYPWAEWLAGTAKSPTKLVFGKDIPTEKRPVVITTQLHQWANILGLWAFTSVAHDKSYIQVYSVPKTKGKARPKSQFPSPKIGTKHMAKKKSAKPDTDVSDAPAKTKKGTKKKSPKKAAKKSAKKSVAKKQAA